MSAALRPHQDAMVKAFCDGWSKATGPFMLALDGPGKTTALANLQLQAYALWGHQRALRVAEVVKAKRKVLQGERVVYVCATFAGAREVMSDHFLGFEAEVYGLPPYRKNPRLEVSVVAVSDFAVWAQCKEGFRVFFDPGLVESLDHGNFGCPDLKWLAWHTMRLERGVSQVVTL